jgi:protein-L-isoaspartate(D-aspartate) O-methyltransferase
VPERGANPTAFAALREEMVRTQIAARGIRDPRVLDAMLSVPRHEFIPWVNPEEAHADHPVDIGEGQTVSQPFMVAFMTESLALKPTDRVLEIGTGCGYQTAVLATLVHEVYSIEIVPELAERAWHDLQRLGYSRDVHTRQGDGYEGWPEAAPFQGIIVTCAPEHIPTPLQEQLAEGGRLVIPVGVHGHQALYLMQKENGRVEKHSVLPVSFVPMTGQAHAHAQEAR